MIYEEMYQEYYQRIFAFTKRLLVDPELAEDMTQETFLRAWRAYDQLYPNSNVLAWLYRIARNVVVDCLRKKHVTSLPLHEYIELPTGEDFQATMELHSLIYGILAKLPKKCREALLLSYVEGYPERIIAEQLGVTRDTVRSRIMWGRRYFKAHYLAGEEAA